MKWQGLGAGGWGGDTNLPRNWAGRDAMIYPRSLYAAFFLLSFCLWTTQTLLETTRSQTVLASFQLPAISQKKLCDKTQYIPFRWQSTCILSPSPDGSARGESPRAQEKGRLGVTSLLPRIHPRDHWSCCLHLEPVSVPRACATFDQLFSAPGPLCHH